MLSLARADFYNEILILKEKMAKKCVSSYNIGPIMIPGKLALVHTLLSKLWKIWSIITTFYRFFKTFLFITSPIFVCWKKEYQTVKNSLRKMAPIFAFPPTSIIFKMILKNRDVGVFVIFPFSMHREFLTLEVVCRKRLFFPHFFVSPPHPSISGF